MYFGKIKNNDISNGPGVRVSLYVSGCRNKCKNCFNPETWNFKYGEEFTEKDLKKILDYLQPSHIEGLTIVGGEPFEKENQESVLEVIKAVRQKYKNEKDIWVFSGYSYDKEIKRWRNELPWTDEIIKNIDVLVDGKFIDEVKDPDLGFRGSSNQRIIDVKKSEKEGKIVYHPSQFNKETKRIWK